EEVRMLMKPRFAEANLVHDAFSKRQLRQCQSSSSRGCVPAASRGAHIHKSTSCPTGTSRTLRGRSVAKMCALRLGHNLRPVAMTSNVEHRARLHARGVMPHA